MPTGVLMQFVDRRHHVAIADPGPPGSSSGEVTVPLRRRPLRVRRRANELRLAGGELRCDIATRFEAPFVVPVDEVAGIARAPRGRLDPECRLARPPRLPALVEDPQLVPDLIVVLRRPRPAPALRGRLGRRASPVEIDGYRVSTRHTSEALVRLGDAGVPIGDALPLLEQVIGIEPDPEHRRAAQRLRQRTTARMVAGLVAAGVLVVGIFTQMPRSLLSGGCLDLSVLPVSASTELILQPFGGAELERAGHQPVAAIFEDRAKGADLLAAAQRAGVRTAWQETWVFPDGDRLTLDALTFADDAGAASYGEYDSTHGCSHRIAEHPIGEGGLTAVQANRPGEADGWELVVVEGRRVHRVYIVSARQQITLERLAEAAGLLPPASS